MGDLAAELDDRPARAGCDQFVVAYGPIHCMPLQIWASPPGAIAATWSAIS